MTENTFSGAEEKAGPNRTVVLGGLAAAVALAGGGYFLLAGGSSDTVSDTAVSAPVVRHHRTVKPAVKAAAKPAAKKPAAQLPKVSTAPIGRDPFRALYVQPVAAAAPAAAPGTSPTSTSPVSSTGATSTTTSKGALYPLTLTGVQKVGPNAYSAAFKVDGQAKTVIPAQRFGKYGELVVLAFETNSAGKVIGVVIQVGDDNPVTVGLGETIKVQ